MPSGQPAVLPPRVYYPPSDPDFECKSFESVEGTYDLRQDIYNDALPPHYSTGTTACLVSIKFKEAFAQYAPLSLQHTPGTASSKASSSVASTENTSTGSHINGTTAEIATSQHAGESDEEPEQHTAPSTIPLSSVPTTTSSSDAASTSLPISAHEPMSPTVASPPNLSQQFAQTSLSSQASSPPSTSTSSSNFSALFSRSKSSKKPAQPKNNIAKTNSSFVNRIITNDALAKILASRTSDDAYLFFNVGKSFVWMDAGGKPKDPLSRVVFTKAHPTSHDVNLLTRGADYLDVIIGFSSGDCIWFDPLRNKYVRLNKTGILNPSCVTMVKWVPGSENIFVASFTDGTLLVLDKEKEDCVVVPNPETPDNGGFQVTHPQKQAKHNPVAFWKVSHRSITAFAFSPDCQHIAIVSLDGRLRVADFVQEKLLDTYSAYFGALNCVAWSPDGRYILTGGQDDLVTIWAFREQRIVARCPGHQSWITGVAFDPWRCDEKVYRFGSVGEDAKLCLWDFSVEALHKPKNASMSVGFSSYSDISSHRPVSIDEAHLPQYHKKKTAPPDPDTYRRPIPHP
ncbi:hypothetical protein BZG36_02977 [Bifiguratus adelaidae]|uniref:Uncharacterized protein n=1 Tax=Bifiguratus adelaidae TaxID=1938954 RepID=A0A261Y0Q3_9FUNG|nr:hypothetical protein BZG36_02977 [Bifiguratus adelaidae]